MKMESDEIFTSASDDSDYSATRDGNIHLEPLFSCEEISETSSEIDVRSISKSLQIVYSSDSENDTNNATNQIKQEEWLDPVGNQPQLTPFVGGSSVKCFDIDCSKVENFFLLLVTDDLFQDISNQTNLYALQVLSQNQSSRLNDWVPTSKDEIKSLFGLILWMGIVRLPEINLYWSRDPQFTLNFPHKVMSRNRFEILLRMIHFTNNEEVDINTHLPKMKVIIDTLNENFRKYYDPPENLCIVESIIPFGGRITLNQYIKQNRHKHGFKIFKLCSKQGYTHSFRIYTGKKSDTEKMIPTNVVMSLSENILEKGHTIFADSWYTSMDLAQKLMAKNTHLVGTIHSHHSDLNKEVVEKKLKRGESFAKEHKTGITLIKWRAKQDILAISTKHTKHTVNIRKKGHVCIKPAIISDYNNNKSAVDLSDRMATHYCPLRKGLKWYKKLAFEILLNTAVVNAWVLYNAANNTSIPILEYRRKLITYLCSNTSNSICNESTSIPSSKKRHKLRQDNGIPAKRRRCVSCYKQNVKNFNSKIARDNTKRVTTFCDDCPDQPSLCLPCFNTLH